MLQVRFVGGHLDVAAAQEALLHERIDDVLRVDQRGCLAYNGDGLRTGGVGKTGAVLKNRIQVLCHRADLCHGGARTAAAISRIVRRKSGGDLAAENALAAGGLIDQRASVGDAAQRAASLSSLQIPFGAQRPVPIHLQIQIILDSERDRRLARLGTDVRRESDRGDGPSFECSPAGWSRQVETEREADHAACLLPGALERNIAWPEG